MAEKTKYERKTQATAFEQEIEAAVATGRALPFAWKRDADDADERYRMDYSLAMWLHYLLSRGEYPKYVYWMSVAQRKAHDLTLPHSLPDLYDLKFVMPDPVPWKHNPSEVWREKRVGRHATEQTLDERKATVDEAMREVRKAARHMQMFPDEPRAKAEEPPKAKTLEELQREAVENPIKFSPGFAERINGKG